MTRSSQEGTKANNAENRNGKQYEKKTDPVCCSQALHEFLGRL